MWYTISSGVRLRTVRFSSLMLIINMDCNLPALTCIWVRAHTSPKTDCVTQLAHLHVYLCSWFKIHSREKMFKLSEDTLVRDFCIKHSSHHGFSSLKHPRMQKEAELKWKHNLGGQSIMVYIANMLTIFILAKQPWFLEKHSTTSIWLIRIATPLVS